MATPGVPVPIERPGWNEVDAKYGQVKDIQPDAIGQISTELGGAAHRVGDHSAALSNAAKELDGVWQGRDADAFVAYIGKLSQAGNNVNDKLDAAAGALTGIADSLRAIKANIERLRTEADNKITEDTGKAEQAATQAQQAEDAAAKDHQSLPPEHKSPAAIRREATEENRKTAARAAADIQRQITHAENAIDAAMGPLKVNVGGGFTEVRGAGITNVASAGTRQVSAGATGGGMASVSRGGGSGGGGAAAVGIAVGAGGFHGGGGAPPPSTPPPGNVDQWIKEAIQILRENGVPVTDADAGKIWQIIQHESGGDPSAINNSDSNAAAGHPSKGLMQTIDSTFNSNKLPGHDDIYNPVDNIIAGVKYTFGRYGGFDGHPGLASMAAGGGYQGY